MKLLLDHCINIALEKELANNRIIRIAPDAKDDVVYFAAKKENAVLITANYKDFDNTGKFPLKRHPGAIVLKATNLTKHKTLLDILFSYLPNKKDYYQKRVLLNETKLTILHKNGKKTELKIKNIRSKKHKKTRSRHKSSKKKKS